MRKLAIFAGGFSAAIFLAQYLLPESALLPGGFCCLLLGLLSMLLPWKWRRRGVVLFVGAALAMGYNWLYLRQVVLPAQSWAGQESVAVMTLQDYPAVTAYGAKATVCVDGIPGRVIYYGNEDLMSREPGDRVEVPVYFSSASRIRDDDVTAFTSKGVFLLAYGRGEAACSAGENSLRWMPVRLGHALNQQIRRVFSGDQAAFLSAIFTGDRSGLSEQLEADLSEAGLSHIMAVSGMHCGYVMAVLILLLGRHRSRLLALAAIPTLWFYALLVGGSPSVVRACVMMTFLLAAPVFRRESDGPTALLSALFVILLKNPYAAASISLQLSFGAAAGLLWLMPKLIRTWIEGRKLGRVRSALRLNLAATLGALIFTIPLAAYYFGAVVLISPLSNLLCLLAASLVFSLGLPAILLSWLHPMLGPAAAILPGLLMRYLFGVAHLLAKVPYHAVYSCNPNLKYWLVFVYLLLAVAYFLGKGGHRCMVALGLSALTLAATVYAGQLPYRHPMDVLVLNVGQGASVLVSSEGEYALVDCGSGSSWFDAGEIAAHQLRTMGGHRLSAILLTHFDSDHINGLSGLLARVPAERLLIPDCIDDNGGREAAEHLAELYGVEIYAVQIRETISLGTASMEVFPPLGEGEDNEQGLSVLCGVNGQELLITGDMRQATEIQLLETYPLPDIEALVAGHHGSRYSTSPELLETLTPEIVCISVGSNSYGHPAEETLRRISRQGCTLYRTDRQGTIHLAFQ